MPSPDEGGVAGYTASIVSRVVEKLAGLVIVVACCWWAASVERSRAADNWLIWGAPLAVFPASYAGRKALDARPTAAHASRMDIAVHYFVGAALGMGIFPAFRRLLAEPVIQTPWLRQAAGALVVVTGAAAALTVVNLAWRGLGAPFAVKLSSRLATDWMYGWTRNPMGLCSACWFASMGLERGSVWFAVNYRIVSVAGERTLWMGALHPSVKRIMHKQIHQNRTDHTSLRGTTFPQQVLAFRSFERCSKPSLDIQQDPVFLDVAANCLHQEPMIDLIKGSLDVKLDHPVIFPAPLSGDGNRLFRRSSRPVSIRVRMEYRIEYRLDDKFDDGLRNAIRHGGDTEFAKAALCLRNFNLLDRRREVRPRRHPVPQFV